MLRREARPVAGVRGSAGFDVAPRGVTEPIARPRGRRSANSKTRPRGRLAGRRSRGATRWLRPRGANRRRQQPSPYDDGARTDRNRLARLSTEHQHIRRTLRVIRHRGTNEVSRRRADVARAPPEWRPERSGQAAFAFGGGAGKLGTFRSLPRSPHGSGRLPHESAGATPPGWPAAVTNIPSSHRRRPSVHFTPSPR
jgi:hypothetical protein